MVRSSLEGERKREATTLKEFDAESWRKVYTVSAISWNNVG